MKGSDLPQCQAVTPVVSRLAIKLRENEWWSALEMALQ